MACPEEFDVLIPGTPESVTSELLDTETELNLKPKRTSKCMQMLYPLLEHVLLLPVEATCKAKFQFRALGLDL